MEQIITYPHSTKQDIQTAIEKHRLEIARLEDLIHNNEFADWDKCKNCGGVGWSYKNGFDMQTAKCVKCNKKQSV